MLGWGGEHLAPHKGGSSSTRLSPAAQPLGITSLKFHYTLEDTVAFVELPVLPSEMQANVNCLNNF